MTPPPANSTERAPPFIPPLLFLFRRYQVVLEEYRVDEKPAEHHENAASDKQRLHSPQLTEVSDIAFKKLSKASIENYCRMKDWN